MLLGHGWGSAEEGAAPRIAERRGGVTIRGGEMVGQGDGELFAAE
ncbi:MAG: hypothetical protein ACKOFW_09910 [Planctomycetaceae bacterium]